MSFNKRSNPNSSGRSRRTARSAKFSEFVEERNKERSALKILRRSQAASSTSPPPPLRPSSHNSDRELPPSAATEFNSIGKITQIDDECGVVNDEVFFSLRVCCGQLPKLGSRVLFESHIGTSSLRRQCNWIASRIQKLSPPSSRSRSRDAAADSRRRRWSPDHGEHGRYSNRESPNRNREQLQRSRSGDLIQSGTMEMQPRRSRELQRSRSREQLQRSLSREQLQRSRSREQLLRGSRERQESQQWEREPEILDRRRRHSKEFHESNRMDEEQIYQSQQWGQQSTEQVRHAALRENPNENYDYEQQWDARRDMSPIEFQNQQQQQSWPGPRDNMQQISREPEDVLRNRMAMMARSNESLNWQQNEREQSRSRNRAPENTDDSNRYMAFDLHQRNFEDPEPLVYQGQQQCDNYRRDENEQREIERERELPNYNWEPQMQGRRQSPDHSWQMPIHNRDEQDSRREFQNLERVNRRRNAEEDRDFHLQTQNMHGMLNQTTPNERLNNRMNRNEELFFQNQDIQSRNRHQMIRNDNTPTRHQSNERHINQGVFQNLRNRHDLDLEMGRNERPQHEWRYPNDEEWRKETQNQNMIMQEGYTRQGNRNQAFQSQEMCEEKFELNSNHSRDQQRSAQMQNPFQNMNFSDNGAEPNKPSELLQGQKKRLSGAQRRKLARELAYAERQKNKEVFLEKVRERKEARRTLKLQAESQPPDHLAMKAKYKWVNNARPALLGTPSTSCQLPPQVPNSLGIVEPVRSTERQQPRHIPPTPPQFTNSLDYYRQAMSSSTRVLPQVPSSKVISAPPKLIPNFKQNKVSDANNLTPQAPPPPIIRQLSKNSGIATDGRPAVAPPPPIITNQLLAPPKKPKLSKLQKMEKKRKVWCILMDEAQPRGYIGPWHSKTFDQTFKAALASANLTSLIKRGWMTGHHVYRITLATQSAGPALQSFVQKEFRKPWPEAQMRLLIGDQLPVVTVFVPVPGGRWNPRAILNKLQKQNKQIHTHLWHIIKTVHLNAGIKYCVAIDGKSFTALAEKMGKVNYIKKIIVFKYCGRPVGKARVEDDDDDNVNDCDDDEGVDDDGEDDDEVGDDSNDDEFTEEDDD